MPSSGDFPYLSNPLLKKLITFNPPHLAPQKTQIYMYLYGPSKKSFKAVYLDKFPVITMQFLTNVDGLSWFYKFCPRWEGKNCMVDKINWKNKMWFPRQLFVIKLLFFPLTNASEMADVTTCEDKFNYLRQKLSP